MGCCPAIGCKNRSGKNKPPGITFHRFPSNPVKRQLWIKALQRKDWEPNSTTCLCSAHFKEEEIDRTANIVRIRDGAVPSVFPSLLSERASRNPRKRRSSESPPSTISSSETCEKIKQTLNIKKKNGKRKSGVSRFSRCNNGVCETPKIKDQITDRNTLPTDRSSSDTEVQRTHEKTEIANGGRTLVPESQSTETSLSSRALEESPRKTMLKTKKNVKTTLPRKKPSKSEESEYLLRTSSRKEIDRRGSKPKRSIDHRFSVPSTSEAEAHQLPTDEHQQVHVEKTLKTQLQRKEERIKSLKKKIRLLQQTTRRMTRRVKNLKEVVNDMKTKSRSQQESNTSLDGFSGASLFLVKRQMIKMEGGKLQRIYNEKLKDFALTLNCLSPPAYDYVRRVFGDCLPHRKTVSKWILKNKKQLTKDTTVGGEGEPIMFEPHDTLEEECGIEDVGLVDTPVYGEVIRADPEVPSAVLGIQLREDEYEGKTLISL